MIFFSDNNQADVVEALKSTSRCLVWYLTVSIPDLCTLTYFYY